MTQRITVLHWCTLNFTHHTSSCRKPLYIHRALSYSQDDDCKFDRYLSVESPTQSPSLNYLKLVPWSLMYSCSVLVSVPSSAKPRAFALEMSSLVGQLRTIFSVASSLFSSTSFSGSSPPTAFNASSISRIVTVVPGIFTILVPGNFSLGMSRAIIRFLTTVLGEQIQISRSLETGKTLFSPFNGSRNIPEAKEDAAPVGLPGLTVT